MILMMNKLKKILLIFLTLLVFHFDISGNDFNDKHLQNILLLFVTLLVLHFDISGNILMMNN